MKKKKSRTRKRKLSRTIPQLSFENYPFSYLLKEVGELAGLRQKYQSSSDKERRQAADFQYHSSFASDLFSGAIGRSGDDARSFPGELYALAIDPNYAPAIATVGSYEYIYGRHEEAMSHFLSLTLLPEDTEDIAIIIDKAGDFLLDNEDFERAALLYSSACREHPSNAVYRNGLSYCLGKLGRHEEALYEARKTVELEPENHVYLNDLGWTLIEAERYEEAREVLEKAVAAAPPDYERARGNLEELHRRMNRC